METATGPTCKLIQGNKKNCAESVQMKSDFTFYQESDSDMDTDRLNKAMIASKGTPNNFNKQDTSNILKEITPEKLANDLRGLSQNFTQNIPKLRVPTQEEKDALPNQLSELADLFMAKYEKEEKIK